MAVYVVMDVLLAWWFTLFLLLQKHRKWVPVGFMALMFVVGAIIGLIWVSADSQGWDIGVASEVKMWYQNSHNRHRGISFFYFYFFFVLHCRGETSKIRNCKKKKNEYIHIWKSVAQYWSLLLNSWILMNNDECWSGHLLSNWLLACNTAQVKKKKNTFTFIQWSE